ncbi:hypothetical protein GTQ40_04720 [Flavobacteriaceae bacterium R38]|nr:hypothetical protein [Flavobacteriaceae bacterium R38]
MKKKNFKNLGLNKKTISNLKGDIKGGVRLVALTEEDSCIVNCEITQGNSCLPIECGVTQVNNSNCFCPQ